MLLPLPLPLPGACRGKEWEDAVDAVGVEHDKVAMCPARAEGVAVRVGWMDGSMEDEAAALALTFSPLLMPRSTKGMGGEDDECELSEEEEEEEAGEAEGGGDSIMEASFDGSRYGAK